jgi:hypothetical protein
MPLVRRALAWAGCAAVAGVLVLCTLYLYRPLLAFEMDRPLPRSISGIYNIETSADESFAWTAGRATIRLPGLDRRVPWNCAVRFRAIRPPGEPFPQLTASVDGVAIGAQGAINQYQDLRVVIPSRPAPGATVILVSDPTFVPGRGDPRELGVQLDRFACNPSRPWVLPPVQGIRQVAVASAVIALAVMIAGGSWLEGAVLVGLAAGAFSALLMSGGAIFGPFPPLVSFWTAAIFGGVTALTRALVLFQRPLSENARQVAWVLAIGTLFKVLALTHPAKPIVDALFQAHRLQWVLEGRYFFTQTMPSGVEFPYAIGLYVFAAPWTHVTSDGVMLLRVVVVLMEALAGALLYAAIVRNGGGSRQALWAVVLYEIVPLPFVVVGNGNLTNAFAQSVSLIALSVIAFAQPRPTKVVGMGVVVIVATWALLSHISTAILLGATLVLVAGAFATIGGQALRSAAVGLAISAALAASVSVFVYYRHFEEVFVTAWNRVGQSSTTMPTDAQVQQSEGQQPVPISRRAQVAGREALRSFGWPIVLLAALGAFTLRKEDLSTPLGCVLLAWTVVWIGATASTVVTRVGPEFERYAVEFLGRVNLATYPALAIVGGRAMSVGAAPVVGMRVAARVLVASALLIGCRAWLGWFS